MSAALVSSTVDLIPTDEHRILLLDDDEDDAVLIADLLQSADLGEISVDWRSTIPEALDAICRERYTVCLVDFRLGPDTGLAFIRRAADAVPHVPVILLTGHDSRDVDLAALNAGAADFLTKADLKPRSLERSIRYAVEQARRRIGLERMARRDPLTGLHNRASIEERLTHATQRALRNNRTMAVVMLDLDGFKAVNDSLGHAAGDALLVIVARRLKSALRGYDVVGRLGGDEFVVILEDLAGPAEAQQVAERLASIVQPPFEIEGIVPPVSASIGYVCFPGPVASRSELLLAADRAMYEAKRAGKGCARAYDATYGNDRPTMTSANCVEEAVRNNRLRLALQPRVNLTTGATQAVECFVRWSPSGSTECPPARFLGELERSGAILDLDSWVFGEALQVRGKLAPSLLFSINISAVDLKTSEFIDRMRTAAQSGIEDFEIEIAESSVLLERADIQDRLRTLKELGFRIAIDRFGTGCSLARLRQLPVDTIKLDRSFVQRLPNSKSDNIMVEAIVMLADRLGINVVAEGVESSDQADRLVELGVTSGQGYWISPPLHEIDLPGWLARRPEPPVRS